MPFNERAKRIALAIVKIFETAKPFGDYSAVAVLLDGAGISYGVNQFTHRSGSLYAVLARARHLGAVLPTNVVEAMGDFQSGKNIAARSQSSALKTALAKMGKDPLVQQAQREIAYEKYLKPAMEACEGSDFELPLSLAVIYDSINHGSFDRIRDRVVYDPPGNGSIKPEEFEKEWITRYVKKRDQWLENHPNPLLRQTDYRTDFFLAQIGRGNWDLKLPLNVHGFRLTDDLLFPDEEDVASVNPFAGVRESQVDDLVGGIGEESATANNDSNPVPPAVETTTNVDEPANDPLSNPQSLPTPSDEGAQMEGFVTDTVTVAAPPPTGFIGKLKAHVASLFLGIGGLAGLKEWFQVQISPETLSLLYVAIPTVLGLGFVGFLVWYISEKVIGFKTLKMQAMYAADPQMMAVNIRPTPKKPLAGQWRDVEYSDPKKPLSVVPSK